MKNYHWTICEPDQPDVIDKGMIRKDEIMDTFLQYPWEEKLKILRNLPEDEICFSPSLEFEDMETGLGVVFSAVNGDAGMEFYIFYKRDTVEKTFLGLSKRQVKGKVSDISDQQFEDARIFLEAFLKNDTAYMEKKIRN